MSYENPWVYKNGNEDRIIDSQDTEGFMGFIYLIENLELGKKYIGKKLLSKAKTLKALKGKKRKRRSRVESNWKEYWGSSEELQEDVVKYGVDSFTRRILRFCKTRAECSYFESKEIFACDALINPLYYNKWVSAKVRSEHLKHLIPG